MPIKGKSETEKNRTCLLFAEYHSHTFHLDHHQRSRYVTSGLEVKFQWVPQLINNQKEKLFDSHKKKLPDERNSSNQPNQSQSQSVIDQANLITHKACLLLKMKRPVPMRSMWHLFTKNCSSDQGNLISRKTWSVFKHVRLKKIRRSELNKLVIDQSNLINTTSQYKTTLKYIMGSRRSTQTMSSFVKELRKTWTSKFQDYHILLWSSCRVPVFKNWFRKSTPTRTDTLFNETYNRVNHLIPSVLNPNKWFIKLETSNCAKYSTWNPKRSAKYVYHTGTSASSTARAGTSCELEQRRIRNSFNTQWTSLLFLTTFLKKGRPHGHRYGRSQGTRNTTSPISSRSAISTTWVSTIDLYEMTNSQGIWLKLVEPKIFVAKWMILRTKITPTMWLHKKWTITKVTGGFVRIRLVLIPCQSCTDLTSNKHCLLCDS